MKASRDPRAIAVVVSSVMLGVALAGSIGAQTARPAATLDDLLGEVRALRSDLARASAASMRLQALVARVSLQEQRLKALGERLADAQRDVDTAVAQRSALEQRLAQLEVPSADASLSEEMQKEVAAVAAALKRDIDAIRKREAQLRATADELSGYLQAEENRWAEFNQRLDEVDRALSATPR